MKGLRDDMDRFERRALELETEQRHRLENGGFHREFWSSRYEQMQSFLILRYRSMSETYPTIDFIKETPNVRTQAYSR